jgi:hypothetical protein
MGTSGGARVRLPGIRIQAIDIVPRPGIGISPIADMDARQTIVTTALAAKNCAEATKKARSEVRSETMTVRTSRSSCANETRDLAQRCS